MQEIVLYLGEELYVEEYLKGDFYESEYGINIDFNINNYLIVKEMEYNIVCVVGISFVGEIGEEKILFISEIKQCIVLDIYFGVSEVDVGEILFFIGFFVLEFDVIGISKGIEFIIVFIFSLVNKYDVDLFLII